MVDRVKGLVFEIEVDSRTGQARLRQFGQQADRTKTQVSGSTSQMAGGFGRLKTALLGLGAGIAVLTALRSGVRLLARELATSIRLSAEQELSERKLTAALESRGIATRENVDALLKQASALQRVTTIGDESIITIQSQLLSFGASTDKVTELAEAVLNLASVTGQDYKGASIAFGKAVAGDTSTLSRYGIKLDETIRQTEGLEAALIQATQIFAGRARAEVDTFTGSLAQFNNIAGDLREEIGGPFRDVLREVFVTVLTPLFTRLTDFADNNADKVRDAIVSLTTAFLDLAISISKALDVLRVFSPVLRVLAERELQKIEGGLKLVGLAVDNEVEKFRNLLSLFTSGEISASAFTQSLIDLRANLQNLGGAAGGAGGGGLAGAVQAAGGGGTTGVGPFAEPIGPELPGLGPAQQFLDAQERLKEIPLALTAVSNSFNAGILSVDAYKLSVRALNEEQARLQELLIFKDLDVKVTEPLDVASQKMAILRSALQETASALLQFAQTGEFSARVLVNAIAQQTFGILSALAIENLILGLTAAAKGLAPTPDAPAWQASAAAHFTAAAKAGALAGAALGLVAATSGGGGGAAAGPTSPRTPRTEEFNDPSERTQEVTIIIEGQGFIQNTEEFARQIARSIKRETRAAGA